MSLTHSMFFIPKSCVYFVEQVSQCFITSEAQHKFHIKSHLCLRILCDPPLIFIHLPVFSAPNRGIEITATYLSLAGFRQLQQHSAEDNINKAREKDREFLYEVKWKDLSPAENTFESVSRWSLSEMWWDVVITFGSRFSRWCVFLGGTLQVETAEGPEIGGGFEQSDLGCLGRLSSKTFNAPGQHQFSCCSWWQLMVTQGSRSSTTSGTLWPWWGGPWNWGSSGFFTFLHQKTGLARMWSATGGSRCSRRGKNANSP